MADEGAPKPAVYTYEKGGLEDYRYATNIVISGNEREFFISFVCGRPYEKPLCVARIIVGPDHLREIIAVLSGQFEKFKNKKKGLEDSGEGRPFPR